MEKVAVLDMTGYRNPTQKEQDDVKRYVRWDGRKERRMYGFLDAFCAVVCVAAIGGLMTAIGSQPVKIIGFDAVIAILAAAGVYGCRAATRRSRQILKAIESGQFGVMDCRAYEADTAPDEGPGGMVMIYNERGQYCREGMPVDSMTCIEWKDHRDIPFLLIRCNYTERNSYVELFTARKLDRAVK